jgi:hypothetical protein
MSGTFPTTPEPRSITRSSLSPTLISVSHSLKRQVRSRGSQQWSFKLAYAPLKRATLAPLEAFLIAQRGQYSTFSFVPPVYGNSSGTVSGTVTVNGAHAAGATSVAISGLTGTLKGGDFIKFAGHSKVYMLTADATATLTVEPPLSAALVTGEAVAYNGVTFTCALATDGLSATINPGDLTEALELVLVEVV